MTDTMVPPAHVLVVEDNPADRTLVKKLLKGKARPCELHFAADGVEAMEFLSGTLRPDLILLDLNLARMDGRETLREIKRSERLRTIPVIVLTTSSNDEDISRAYALQA